MALADLWSTGWRISRYSTDEDWLVPHFEKCFMTMPN
jgi:uncharacterized protein YyaL (SSP411 family)